MLRRLALKAVILATAFTITLAVCFVGLYVLGFLV